MTPAVRNEILKRMLSLRQSSVDRVGELTGAAASDLKRFRRELLESPVPQLLVQRGAGLPMARELPQGALLYLLIRAALPERVVETGVRPGYSTAWLLAALEANGSGELVSLGPGSADGRMPGVSSGTVGQFVAPSLRRRWSLVLGNSEDRLDAILREGSALDVFFYDNGTNLDRTRFELRRAWAALSDRGILLAHHVDTNSAWAEFCGWQGSTPQLLDAGPPALGALSLRGAGGPRRAD